MDNVFLFGVTFLITVLNGVNLLGLTLGNSFSYPHAGLLDPTSWIFFYPSITYQAIYWAPVLMYNT